MNEQDRNESYIHPAVLRVLRIAGAVLLALTIYFSAATAFTFCLGLFADGEHVVQLPWQDSPVVALQDIPTQEQNIYVDPSQMMEVARVEIAVAGDVMMHLPIVRSSQTVDGFDFTPIFSYLKPYVSSADFAVANLETTLSGTDGLLYTGYPNFNSPDAIARCAKDTGFDMLLTGNNHSYDYGTAGLKRTLEVIQESGLTGLGTLSSADQPRYTVQSVGGIEIGMVCYTFGEVDDGGSVTINGMTTDAAADGLINAFDYNYLSRFYTEIEGEIAAMRADGVDAIVMYIHWGDEYSTIVSDTQRTIAQTLCDLGIDVIIGSHPHVVQPLELLTSTVDPTHKTICLYSTGSLLGNLRADTIGMTTGYCEDGVMLRFTLAKYNDGSVRVNAVRVLPTWILVQGTDENRDFFIIPLDQSVSDWMGTFGLTSSQYSDAKNSYNRTMELVTPGLNKIANYLNEKNASLDPSLGVG
ncbi:MAG: CapA family protein [Oscillospiraceae bacterium]|nr:CapA family protein [Oscillospiraceae bacterium]